MVVAGQKASRNAITATNRLRSFANRQSLGTAALRGLFEYFSRLFLSSRLTMDTSVDALYPHACNQLDLDPMLVAMNSQLNVRPPHLAIGRQGGPFADCQESSSIHRTGICYVFWSFRPSDFTPVRLVYGAMLFYHASYERLGRKTSYSRRTLAMNTSLKAFSLTPVATRS